MGSSKSKPIEFPQVILDQMRCSVCKNYLSCGPIQLLQNSTSVCGRCATAEASHNYRQVNLEVALSQVTFPCRYKRYGCDQKQSFGQALHHETDCAFKPFACPSLPYTTCAWQGSVTQVSYHFFQEHPAVTTQFSQFRLDVGKDKNQALLIVKDGVSFVIKYKYDGTTSVLNYDVRYFTTSAVEATYKIKLVNNLNPELNVNLKSSKCLAFSPQITEMQALTVNKFLEVLENPTALTVVVDISIKKITPLVVKARVLINYKLLDTLRCEECQNYLAIPIFDCSKGTICADCAERYTDCVPSKNAELYKLITEVNYPCRWCNCKFIGKGYYIRIHELVCKYYPYNCPKSGCKTILTRAKSISMFFHLGFFHDYFYFSRSTIYSTKYALRDKPEKFMITFIQNEMVLIKHCKGSENSYIFSLQTFRPAAAAANKAIAARIYFEHFHCTLKSKTFVLDNKTNLIVTADKLPKCFNIDKLTVVINI